MAAPRDRDSSFDPELVKKRQTRIDSMDDKIIGLYATGLTVCDIQSHLLDLYGLKVSPDLIGRVTDAVLDEIREWHPIRPVPGNLLLRNHARRNRLVLAMIQNES